MLFPSLPTEPGQHHLTSAPESSFGLLAEQLSQQTGQLMIVLRDDARMQRLAEMINVILPETDCLTFPAWDCLPYDRSSPNPTLMAERVRTLCHLATLPPKSPVILLTTINAAIQRVPPRSVMAQNHFHLAAGETLDREALTFHLAQEGYHRVGKVMEPGEFAIRGSIIDLFPASEEQAYRIDCFDDEIETIKPFDPLTQRTDESESLATLTLLPANEVLLSEERITHFRQQFREHFGAGMNHPLYQSISEGRAYPGMEHWLPLFYPALQSLFDYLSPTTPVLFDHLIDQARIDRMELIQDYFEARQDYDANRRSKDESPYHALPPDALTLSEVALDRLMAGRPSFLTHAFSETAATEGISLPCRPAYAFTAMRAQSKAADQPSLMEQLKAHIRSLQEQKKRVLIACASDGSRERIRTMLSEQQLHCLGLNRWADARDVKGKTVGLITLPMEQGLVIGESGPGIAIISEQDIFGERIIRATRKKKSASAFLQEAATLGEGELIVHKEHGIGRFAGLETVTVGAAPHDCFKLVYRDDDRLFVPVENAELISRYGSEDEEVQLDKLGGAGWQSRRAKMKQRIKLAAEKLLAIAAERTIAKADVIPTPEGMYDEFCARFPYAETEDQLGAIADVIEDLQQGKPMDRLICGDVGFGKTEVALRAAFMAAFPFPDQPRRQVALICPTTLLARQHAKTFTERFAGLPFTIRQLSRLVPAKEQRETKERLAEGKVDIVIGTHAMLAKDVSFKQLGLVIIDEEQNFGVAQKERLKEFRGDVHVMTLTATPIPRTLQLSLTGIKELSLITTPPVDRLAVRTFVAPFDPVTIREAVLREHFRGGKIFCVCPRIKDMDPLAAQIRTLIPEIKIAQAHGQMAPKQLDTLMNDFYDGKFDMLLSTNIVESGLDIPDANTLIVHKAHLFGLSQLYQLRGRVGRGKTRAYAYFTLPHGVNLTKQATKRLEVMQTLDTLGAGFTIASHDMDIRGFGNILGDEQTGHIREVGVELYQQMLEEAVENLRKQKEGLSESEESFSPQINLGMAVMIPEDYVPDLASRMGLYRRISSLANKEEIDAFAVEMVDRFGPIPEPLENLLSVVRIKQLCLKAGVAKVDAGPKGIVVTFHNNQFGNPAGLVDYIAKKTPLVKLRHDHKLVIHKSFDDAKKRLDGVKDSIEEIEALAA